MALTNAELKWATILALTEPPMTKPGPPEPGPPEPGPYLVLYSNGRFSLKTENLSKNWNGQLEYSKDLTSWGIWLGEEIIADTKTIYLRGTNNRTLTPSGLSHIPFIIDSDKYVYCSGNIETLLDYTSFLAGIHPKMAQECFSGLFLNCESLRSAPTFPDTVVPFSTGVQSTSSSFFSAMFKGCSSLLEGPPSMPKYGLNNSVCRQMFMNCTSLIKGPELPATTLGNGYSIGDNCYFGMFQGCTSLEEAPDIHVENLPNYYLCADMFNGCTSLKKAPKIYASGPIGYGNFLRMFKDCISLENLPKINLTDFGESTCEEMFSGCTNIKLSTNNIYPYAYRIPYSGTGVSQGRYTFFNMFSGTGGPFTGTPTINTTYYTDHEPV